MLYFSHMKKGGTRSLSARTSAQEPRESWRKWVLVMVALGFALLVITLLMKQNKMLVQNVDTALSMIAPTSTAVAGAEHVAGDFETISEKSFSATAGKDREFIHQCKGTIKTVVPLAYGYLGSEDVASYCVGTNQLVYVDTLGNETVLSETVSTSADDAPMIYNITHLRGTESKNTYLISYGAIPCSYVDDECGVGMASNYVNMAFDTATETLRTLVHYPEFGEALWNSEGTKAIFPVTQVGGAGCDDEQIVGYNLETDETVVLTERAACAEETLGSSTDVEGNPLPAWGPVIWTSPTTFTTTILETNGTWTTVNGTF